MIHKTTGDILKAPVEALVNPVNCVGVMGRGLAEQFKHAYPAMFSAYQDACRAGLVQPGKMWTWANTTKQPGFIVNFPTKKHWRDPSTWDYIGGGLVALVAEVQKLGIHSIALPKLGCGLGGLPWRPVELLIGSAFSKVDVEVLVFE